MLMMTEPQRDLVRDKGTKLGRFLIGFSFFASGLTMLLMTGPENVGMYFQSLGLPMATQLVWPVIIFKVLAGLAVMLGYRVGLSSALLIGFTAFATIIAHRDFADPALLKNLGLIGGLLYLLAYGPGGMHTKQLREIEQDPHTQNAREE